MFAAAVTPAAAVDDADDYDDDDERQVLSVYLKICAYSRIFFICRSLSVHPTLACKALLMHSIVVFKVNVVC